MVHGQLGARVKPIPADPENECAKCRNGHVVAWNGLRSAVNIFADTGAKQYGTDQSSPSSYRVNDRGTCEVNKFFIANAVQPTSVPFPATSNRVNDCSEHESENNKFAKFHSLGDKTGHDGCSCASKCCLKKEINSWNQASFADGFSRNSWVEEQALEIQPAINNRAAVHQ